MSRVATTYYGADADTLFQWATDDDDPFDRELDLSFLARALERHDHSNTRGLAVTRIAAGIIDATALGPLSVTTAKIDNGAVGTTQLANGSVTKPKLAATLAQATNDAAGGLRLSDSTAAYPTWWYVSAAGEMVFGFGVSTVAFFINQLNKIAFGTTMPATAHKFNFTQSGTTSADGIRVQSPANAAHMGGLYVDTSGNFWVHSATSSIFFGNAAATVTPGTDNSTQLGTASLRWSNGYFVVCTILTLSCSAFATNSFSANSASISGHLNLGTLAVSTATFTGINNSGTSSCNICGCNQVNCAGQVNAATVAASGQISAGSFVSSVFNAAAGNVTANNADITSSLRVAGAAGTHNLTCAIDSCAKPGGGSWAAYSDIRSKHEDRIRPYDRGLTTILQLAPIWYQYNGRYGMPDDGIEYVGFRAEELKEIVPSMVKTAHYPGDDKIQEEDFLTVQDTELPYMAITAIKELHQTIEELVTRVEYLEAQAAK